MTCPNCRAKMRLLDRSWAARYMARIVVWRCDECMVEQERWSK